MKKQEPTFFGKIYPLIGVLLAFALIMGILAGNFDPRSHILIAFFGLAYPFILFLNVIMIVIWILRGKLLFALLTAGVIGIGWHAMMATVSFNGEAGEGAKSSPDLVRIMTYNVHSFGPYDDNGDKEITKQKMLALVKNENPDIICFQEYVSMRKGPFDVTDSLKDILNIRSQKNYFIPPLESNANGFAIYSRYPIVNTGIINFTNERGGNASIYIDIMLNEKVLRVYNVHMQSIAFDRQDYKFLDKVTKDMDPEITPAKRILRMLDVAFKKRAAQVDIMKAEMKGCKTPFVIAGDFNDTPASYAVTQMTKSLNNSFVQKGTGLGRTYNGKFPNFQIDYISATKTIKIINHRIIEAKLSDHFPVRSDLRID